MKVIGKLMSVFVASLGLPRLLLAAAPPAERTVVVADARLFHGFRAWLANLYNESLLWYAMATIVIVPGSALILSKLTDIWMARLGIDLKSRKLAEH